MRALEGDAKRKYFEHAGALLTAGGRGVARSEARVWAVRLGCRRARAEAQIAGLGGAARTSR